MEIRGAVAVRVRISEALALRASMMFFCALTARDGESFRGNDVLLRRGSAGDEYVKLETLVKDGISEASA